MPFVRWRRPVAVLNKHRQVDRRGLAAVHSAPRPDDGSRCRLLFSARARTFSVHNLGDRRLRVSKKSRGIRDPFHEFTRPAASRVGRKNSSADQHRRFQLADIRRAWTLCVVLRVDGVVRVDRLGNKRSDGRAKKSGLLEREVDISDLRDGRDFVFLGRRRRRSRDPAYNSRAGSRRSRLLSPDSAPGVLDGRIRRFSFCPLRDDTAAHA